MEYLLILMLIFSFNVQAKPNVQCQNMTDSLIVGCLITLDYLLSVDKKPITEEQAKSALSYCGQESKKFQQECEKALKKK